MRRYTGHLVACALIPIGCTHRTEVNAQSQKIDRGQQCSLPAHAVFFEYQVDSPARVIPDSTHPHPTSDPFAVKPGDPAATVVQFVVDTTGTPVAETFRILKTPSSEMARSVSNIFMRWRFRPAQHGACKVPQLLQTGVVP